eukprot:TRINITY_DN54022_c0_g2_i1.p1 TRINITY_DN54022_c0_g2~~TRINITY_DN54022_c0_g2_i1.p1  ORF type:complete len:499 (-),score=129.98 TRINITY_DN54022_c0_g2_i1:84-1580(-)
MTLAPAAVSLSQLAAVTRAAVGPEWVYGAAASQPDGSSLQVPQSSAFARRMPAALMQASPLERGSALPACAAAALLATSATCRRCKRHKKARFASRQRQLSKVCRTAGAAAVETSAPALQDTIKAACRACVSALGPSEAGKDDDAGAAQDKSPQWTTEAEEAVAADSAYYGRWRVSNLPRMQATTLGNMLRRTLLREDIFRCHAPVGVRVRYRTKEELEEGAGANRAPHEFASVPGVKESMIDVVRNVQQMSVSPAPVSSPGLPLSALAANGSDSETWRWAARRCGPCAVTAEDLDMMDGRAHYEFPLQLPELKHHLCRVTAPVMLELEVEVACCSQTEWETSPHWTQYLSRQRQKGWLSVPPIFCPVKKCNYMVKEGDDGSSDLFIEVWTRISARPSALLRTSAQALLAALQAREEKATPPDPEVEKFLSSDDDDDSEDDGRDAKTEDAYDQLFEQMPGQEIHHERRGGDASVGADVDSVVDSASEAELRRSSDKQM